ncbi:hypothetical protein glysoja_027049 [Glycine soja]|uniref:Uncharacterized protein n=1 Tax=Glycine soja TaxID=3848 RepID=A0A0B2QTV5_GLYSO|nr:hypothetical protein glysoja_027049 [Glycine soja]
MDCCVTFFPFLSPLPASLISSFGGYPQRCSTVKVSRF